VVSSFLAGWLRITPLDGCVFLLFETKPQNLTIYIPRNYLRY